ncbi:MAG TPA: hypothetical protein VH165_27445 [Kofleriaceae bacterium]|nr:hypothetical protein [Kofleriaceae bacterium]
MVDLAREPAAQPASAAPVAPAAHEPTSAAVATIDARLHAVEQLIKIFRIERYIYLAISISTFVFIVVFAAYLFVSGNYKDRTVLFGVLFTGSGGVMLYISGQFLKMWSQALQVLGGKVGE